MNLAPVTEVVVTEVAATRLVVTEGSFLTLHYRLADAQGVDLVNTFAERPATLSIGGGELAPAMERCLMGMAEGERRSFELPAGDAFGDHNPAMVQRVAMKLLHELGDVDAQYQVGDVVQFPAPDGGAAAFSGVVKEVGEGWLQFDFNHPLAGQALSFEAQIIGVL